MVLKDINMHWKVFKCYITGIITVAIIFIFTNKSNINGSNVLLISPY